jgi:hypothetical protein
MSRVLSWTIAEISSQDDKEEEIFEFEPINILLPMISRDLGPLAASTTLLSQTYIY